MSNAIPSGAEHRRPTLSSERKARSGSFKIGRLIPSSQAIRDSWGDFLTLASIVACAWLLLKIAVQVWR